MIDMMGDSMSREDLLEYITRMSSTVRIVNSLLENLLEWARLQMDQVAFSPCVVDLHELAARTTELLAPGGEQEPVSVRNEMPEDRRGYGDLNMVDTVIRNLSNNAVKFTPAGGSVTISGAPGETMVTITISIGDTGVGVPADRLDTLFVLDKGSTTNGTQGKKEAGWALSFAATWRKRIAEKSGPRVRKARAQRFASRYR